VILGAGRGPRAPEWSVGGPHERLAGRRRRRRAVLPASGSRSPLGASAYRSIRMTGRIITAA